MSNYVVSDTSLTSMADAIRAKGGTTAALEYTKRGFAQAISDIETGGGGMSDEVKMALLALLEHVVYTDSSAQGLYAALAEAMGNPLPEEQYVFYDYIGLQSEANLRQVPTFYDITGSYNVRLSTSVSASSVMLVLKHYPDLWALNYELDIQQHTIMSSAANDKYNILLGGRDSNNRIFGFYHRCNGLLLSLQTKGINRSSEFTPSTERRHASIVVDNDNQITTFSYAGNDVEYDWSGGANINEGYLYVLGNRNIADTSRPAIPILAYVGAVTVRDPDTLTILDRYVPAVRKVDNVIGMFNTIDKNFYTIGDAKYATVGNSYCIYTVGNWT